VSKELKYSDLEWYATLAKRCLLASVVANALMRCCATFWTNPGLPWPFNEVMRFGFGMGFIALALLVMATPIYLLSWQFEAQRNLRFFKVRNAPRPWLALACWFIPVVNLAAPVLIVRDLFKASNPIAPQDWQKTKTPGLLWIWWACWLSVSVYVIWYTSNPATLASVVCRAVLANTQLNRLETDMVLTIVETLVYSAAALSLVRIISTISANQRTKYHMLVGHPAPEPALPIAEVAEEPSVVNTVPEVQHERA
jgi:hypothetical protein